MKTLLISTEGRSEDTFVRVALQPHLQAYGLHAKSIILGTGLGKNGGWTKLSDLQNEIDRALYRSAKRNPFVATMYDFSDIREDFPDYKSILAQHDKYVAVALAESILQGSFPSDKFIPYFQLHQSESLIFTQLNILLQRFPSKGNELIQLENCKNEYNNNPELINSSNKPSKRIEAAFNVNEKAFKGITIGNITAEIGIPTLRQACRHFNDWLTKLKTLA